MRCAQEEIQRKGDINAKSHEMRLELLYLSLDKYHDTVHAPGRICTAAVRPSQLTVVSGRRANTSFTSKLQSHTDGLCEEFEPWKRGETLYLSPKLSHTHIERGSFGSCRPVHLRGAAQAAK